MRLLSCDTGFASFGWALSNFDGEKLDFFRAGVITTKPSAKKRKVLGSDDNLRRLTELVDSLAQLVEQARVVCVESLSLPRNAGSSAKMGMAMGAVLALARARRCPILQATPVQVKRALTGNAQASKAQMIDAAAALTRHLLVWDAVPDGVYEHIADAIGVAFACTRDDSLRVAAALRGER